MFAYHLIIHHWHILAAVAVCAMPAAFVLRHRLARLVRIGRALATDKRLPRHVRWIFRASLIIKCSPLDFGLDETLFCIGAVIVATRHRDVWQAIKVETRKAT